MRSSECAKMQLYIILYLFIFVSVYLFIYFFVLEINFHFFIYWPFISATRDTIVMTRKMSEAGADAVLVVTPCYFTSLMNNQALVQHYTKVTRFIQYEWCLFADIAENRQGSHTS